MTSPKEIDSESVQYKEWRRREQSNLEHLERVTKSPQLEQEKLLEHILRKNAETEYLQRFDLNGATDVKRFRKHLPVSDYDSIKPYIDRIYQGDTSPVVCADPVIEILRSSGTSNGIPKIYPVTEEDVERRYFFRSLRQAVLNRAIPGLEKGKYLFLVSMRKSGQTPGGLPCHSTATSFYRATVRKVRPFNPSSRLTSPPRMLYASDKDQIMYCHLLLALLQREEILRIGSLFAVTIQIAMRNLEEMWHELYDDIKNGTLNPKMNDADIRAVVLPLLRSDPKLAELVHREFSTGRASDGVLKRLFPNVKAIDTVCTGSMEAYLPAIANYSDNLPVICTEMYAATEGYFGINMDPLCLPEKICYTLLPDATYYEFIAVADGEQALGAGFDEVLDLMSLKEGQEYEILVTTVSGLYRYRMGDILKMVGFYNSTPTFQFIRRRDVVLSINTEKTDERVLQVAVSQASKVLEKELGLRLLDYTSTPDFSTKPGHYVVFWELTPQVSLNQEESSAREVLERCCEVMEANLTFSYRQQRNDKLVIGALELRLVQEGTFNLLANHAFSQGSSFAQYKTPRGIHPKSTGLLEILNQNVFRKVFAVEKPPLTGPGATY